jgi:hypothetical protein
MKVFIVLLALISLTFSGCAVSHMATDFGGKIGKSYKETYDKGIPTADQIIIAWPYISGQIKGLVMDDYKTKIVPAYVDIITGLDDLVAKPEKTDEDKGKIVGMVVRLEVVGGKYFHDNYGLGLFDLIKRIAGV